MSPTFRLSSSSPVSHTQTEQLPLQGEEGEKGGGGRREGRREVGEGEGGRGLERKREEGEKGGREEEGERKREGGGGSGRFGRGM